MERKKKDIYYKLPCTLLKENPLIVGCIEISHKEIILLVGK